MTRRTKKLTAYQAAVVETWVTELHSAGFNREEAIAQAQCQLSDDCADAVRAVFDRCWPSAEPAIGHHDSRRGVRCVRARDR